MIVNRVMHQMIVNQMIVIVQIAVIVILVKAGHQVLHIYILIFDRK